MKQHEPYTEQDWGADKQRQKRGEPLECPDCDFSGDYRWYGPRCRPDGRHYRMCKKCGFWQAADGKSPAQRCWKSTHECVRRSDEPYTCTYCTVGELAPEASVITHQCGKYLMESDRGYTCPTCEKPYGRESEVPWPRSGSE